MTRSSENPIPNGIKSVAGFRFGDGYLVLLAEGPDAKPRIGRMQVAVKVSGIDAEHVRLKSAGVEVGPLASQPWGERSFRFFDPDGYEWSYGQPAEASPETTSGQRKSRAN